MCSRRVIAKHRSSVQQPIAVAYFENSVYFTDITKMLVGRLNVYETAPQVQTINANYDYRPLDVVVAHPVLQSIGKSAAFICLLKKINVLYTRGGSIPAKAISIRYRYYKLKLLAILISIPISFSAALFVLLRCFIIARKVVSDVSVP